jgi:hypothetical protein
MIVPAHERAAMAAAEQVDLKYYEAAPPRSLGERLVIAARDRIYADFVRHCQPRADDAILDVGVSDVVNDAANMLERKLPRPRRITAAGLGAAPEFQAAFPDVAYVQIEPNRPLPFPDKSFDIAASNAVLEHVGSADNQARFIAELTRVARTVFVSVPHRYFAVEHHTAIPLLHYFDMTFAPACRWLGKSEWADERNLILMSWRRLASLVPQDAAARIGYTGIPLGPFSSNLFMLVGEERP